MLLPDVFSLSPKYDKLWNFSRQISKHSDLADWGSFLHCLLFIRGFILVWVFGLHINYLISVRCYLVSVGYQSTRFPIWFCWSNLFRLSVSLACACLFKRLRCLTSNWLSLVVLSLEFLSYYLVQRSLYIWIWYYLLKNLIFYSNRISISFEACWPIPPFNIFFVDPVN